MRGDDVFRFAVDLYSAVVYTCTWGRLTRLAKIMSLSLRRAFSLQNNSRKRDICFCLLLFVFTTEASKRLDEDHTSHSESTGYSTYYDDTSEDGVQEEQALLPPLGDIDSRLYIVINFPTWDDCIATYPTSIQVAHLMSSLQEVRIVCFTHGGKAIDR